MLFPVVVLITVTLPYQPGPWTTGPVDSVMLVVHGHQMVTSCDVMVRTGSDYCIISVSTDTSYGHSVGYCDIVPTKLWSWIVHILQIGLLDSSSTQRT